MGVKGFKVDFLDRDDQEMVRFTYEAAELCAKYHMILDFHGVYKPTGLQRTLFLLAGVVGLYPSFQTRAFHSMSHATTSTASLYLRIVTMRTSARNGLMC